MPLDGFDKFTAQGQRLLDGRDSIEVHSAFQRWVIDVSRWLNSNYPNSGLSATWASLGDSNLVVGGEYYDNLMAWTVFRMMVQGRLRWLGNLPTTLRLSNLSAPSIIQNEAKQAGRKEIKLSTTSRAYVDPNRIDELKTLPQSKYDLSKLILLCEELNICFAAECYMAMIVLTRALLDHVPPIFGCGKFSEVSNNYTGGKSFKEAMGHLEYSSRKIADYYLHSQIRQSETLPNVTQIDFSNDIDFLLAEVVRLLK